MMITKLNENIKKIVDQDNRIRHYLESLTVNVDFTPRSWIYDGKNGNPFLKPEEILNKWVTILQQKLLPNEADISGAEFDSEALPEAEILSRVYQFDTAQIEKWGPQGGHAPMAELLDDIVLPSFKLGESHEIPKAFVAKAKDLDLLGSKPVSSRWQQAKRIVAKAFVDAIGKEVLRPASYKSVVDDMRARDTLESNSGFPMFARRNLPEVIAQAVSAAESGEWTLFPAIALFRTYNAKTRLVWMYPMSANLVEGSYFQPLQSAIMNAKPTTVVIRGEAAFSFKDFFSPWEGFEAVRKVVTQAYDATCRVSGYAYTNVRAQGCVAASDFSATDEHFQRWSTLEVYDVIKLCFQRTYWEGLKESLLHMHKIPLVIGPNEMVTGWHGVSSGSNWTNFVETVFDMIFSVYSALKVEGGSLNKRDSMLTLMPLYAIGDDQAYLYAFKNSRLGNLTKQNTWASKRVKDLLNVAGHNVGQEIKPEKTTANFWQVKTLQRLFIRDYRREDGQLRGVYSTIRALKSSVYPERFHAPSKWSSDMFCARQFMILENCVDHPLFKEFVEFICKGNQHLVPFAKKSAGELDAILRKTKLIPGLNSTYNQEKRDQSLASFASIQIAREL